MDSKKSFYQFTSNELDLLFAQNNLPPSGVKLLFRWHYKKKNIKPCIDDLALKTQKYIKENFEFNLPEIINLQDSSDGTVKFLLKLNDNKTIETVIIPFASKYTLCISSQVGCAMNCSFCYTGTQGLTRHLSVEEIVSQFILAARWLDEFRPEDKLKRQLTNIVFMGQGEPLHNFENTKKACEIFLDEHGLCLGIQKITVSTAGYLPGLMRWNTEMPKVNLALSLHSTRDEIRNELIPINQRYPLHEILKYIEDIPLGRKQYVIYEYLLINNLNDSEEDAHSIGKLFFGKKAIINLIPFNPFPNSKYQRPEHEKIMRFQQIIDSYEIAAIVRGTKGDDILAACGQLNTKKI